MLVGCYRRIKRIYLSRILIIFAQSLLGILREHSYTATLGNVPRDIIEPRGHPSYQIGGTGFDASNPAWSFERI